MKQGKMNQLILVVSRTVCSILWVAVTCWFGFLNIIVLLGLAEASTPALGVWIALYLLVYLLLGVWTAMVYRSWHEWRFALIIQGALVILAMVFAGVTQVYTLFRPLTLLINRSDLTGRLFSGNSIVCLFLDYLVAFVEISILQFIAIVCRWVVTRKSTKVKKNTEAN